MVRKVSANLKILLLLETTGDYFYSRMLGITEDYWRQLDAVTSFLAEDNDTRWPSVPS